MIAPSGNISPNKLIEVGYLRDWPVVEDVVCEQHIKEKQKYKY